MNCNNNSKQEPKFLKNAWYMAGWITDFPQKGLFPITLLGEPIVLYRQTPTGWTALENVCCHRLVPLSIGRQEGNDIRCMYHGLKFAPDGRCIEIPGQDRISSSIKVRSYPIEEKHGAIWVWMGLPEYADVTNIAPIPGTDNPDLSVGTASVDIEGDASLIWDNLMDLSHIPFVHANSFGGGDPVTNAISIAAEAKNLDMEIMPNGIHTARWHKGKPSHLFLGDIQCDDYVTTDFIAPGVLLVRTLSYKAGIQDHYNGEIPEQELLSIRVSCQVVTPVTDTTAKIFFNVGSSVQFKKFIPKFLDIAKMALKEDKLFIDAQQAMIRSLPDKKPMALSMDVGVTRFSSLMKQLLEKEHKTMATAMTEQV